MSSINGNTATALEADMPAGKRKVSGHERQILGLIIEGCNNREIARRLSVSEQSVRRRLDGILRRFGLTNRLELVLFTMHYNLVERNGDR